MENSTVGHCRVEEQLGSEDGRPYLVMEYLEGETAASVWRAAIHHHRIDRDWHAGRGRAGRGARARIDPRGHQAIEHFSTDSRPGEAVGLASRLHEEWQSRARTGVRSRSAYVNNADRIEFNIGYRPMGWRPDSRAIQFLRETDGVTNIWGQPLDGKPPVQISRFKSGHIYSFAWSRDGKRLALAKGALSSDAILIHNVR